MNQEAERETKDEKYTPLLNAAGNNSLQSEEVLFENLAAPTPRKWQRILQIIIIALLFNCGAAIVLASQSIITIFIAKWILLGSIIALLALSTHLRLLTNYKKKSTDELIKIRLTKLKKLSHKNIPTFIATTLSLCLITTAVLVGSYFPEFNITRPLIIICAICYAATALALMFHRAQYTAKFNDTNYSFSTPLSKENVGIFRYSLFAISIIVVLSTTILFNADPATFLPGEAFLGINAIVVFNTTMLVIAAFLALRWLAAFFPTITPKAKLDTYIKKIKNHCNPDFCCLLDRIAAYKEHDSIPPELTLAMCDILGFLAFKSPIEQSLPIMRWLAADRKNLIDAAQTFSYIPSFTQDPKSFEHLIPYLDDSNHLSDIFSQLERYGLLKNSFGSINKTNFHKLLRAGNKAFFKDLAESNDDLPAFPDSEKRSYWNLLLTYPDCVDDINRDLSLKKWKIKAALPFLKTRLDIIKFAGRQALAAAKLGSIRAKPFLNFEDLTDEKEIRFVGKVLAFLHLRKSLTKKNYQAVMQCSHTAEPLYSILLYLDSTLNWTIHPSTIELENRQKIFEGLIRIIQIQDESNKPTPDIFTPLKSAIEKIVELTTTSTSTCIEDYVTQQCIQERLITILLISPALISLLDPQHFPKEDWEAHTRHVETILRFLDGIGALTENYQKLIDLIKADNTKAGELARIAGIISTCPINLGEIPQQIVFQMIMDYKQPDLLQVQEEDILPKLEAVKLAAVLEENNPAGNIPILPLVKNLQNIVGDFFIPKFSKFREEVHMQFSAKSAKQTDSKTTDEKCSDSKWQASVIIPTDQQPGMGLGLGESKWFTPSLTRNPTIPYSPEQKRGASTASTPIASLTDIGLGLGESKRFTPSLTEDPTTAYLPEHERGASTSSSAAVGIPIASLIDNSFVATSTAHSTLPAATVTHISSSSSQNNP